jgi:catechol 2,3-dioxygenase-like lactoylglutathione lyase family enzyme
MTSDDWPIFPTAFFAGLVTRHFLESWAFYTTHLGFRTTDERNAYVRLMHPGGAQLVLLREEADHTPAELVSANNGRGLWLTLEVADVATEREALGAAGLRLQSVPSEKWWPAGSFSVADPDGVLVIIAPRKSLVRAAVPVTVHAAA